MMSVNNIMNSAAKVALLPVFIAKSVYSEVLCYRKEEKFYKSFPNDIFAISESQAEQVETEENARFSDAKYNIVIQRHANTCGLICLAILTGKIIAALTQKQENTTQNATASVAM